MKGSKTAPLPRRVLAEFESVTQLRERGRQLDAKRRELETRRHELQTRRAAESAADRHTDRAKQMLATLDGDEVTPAIEGIDKELTALRDALAVIGRAEDLHERDVAEAVTEASREICAGVRAEFDELNAAIVRAWLSYARAVQRREDFVGRLVREGVSPATLEPHSIPLPARTGSLRDHNSHSRQWIGIARVRGFAIDRLPEEDAA